MKNFIYTISCLFLQNLLSNEFKYFGFQKIEFESHSENKIHKGLLIFNKEINNETIKILTETIGIYFYEIIDEYNIKFNFIKIDSNYYNIIEREFIHDLNPFTIKTFKFENQNIEENNSSIMLFHDNFIHVTSLEEEIFIYKNFDYCFVCNKKKEIIRFNNLCNICKNCFIFINDELNVNLV